MLEENAAGKVLKVLRSLSEEGSRLLRNESSLVPVSVRKTGDACIVTAELPGVPGRDIRVTASGPSIEISGEKRKPEEAGTTVSDTRHFGAFHVEIPLPHGYAGQARAAMHDGLLDITVLRGGADPVEIAITREDA